MDRVARAATIAAQVNATAVPPAAEHRLCKLGDPRQVRGLESGLQLLRIGLEVGQPVRWSIHRWALFCIHFKLCQRSSFLRVPRWKAATISPIASSTVFFGLNP